MGSSDTVKRQDSGKGAIDVALDWIAVCVLSIAVLWACSQLQHYHPETDQVQHHGPAFFRATLGIARRVGADLVQFVFSLLAMVAELFLEARNKLTATVFQVGTGLTSLVAGFDPALPNNPVYLMRFDVAYHSHYANLARQHLRGARALLFTILCWVIPIGAVLTFIVTPLINNSTSLESHDIHPYVVPIWVIKARPEDRPRDGSSSHYRPRPDCIDIQGFGEDDVYSRLLPDFGSVEIVHELQAHPTTVTRTLVYAETGTRSVSG